MPPSRSAVANKAEATRVKRHGVHYTPGEIADFLAQRALSLVPNKHLRVLDPACGDGALLAAVARAIGGRSATLYGIDRDPKALARARQRLLPFRTEALSVELHCSDFLADTAKTARATGQRLLSSEETMSKEAFDIVIANPPYVRTQILGSSSAQTLAKAFGLSGRVDLYHAFVVAMTAALRTGGALALLCSNRFLTTMTGQDLRRFLATNYNLDGIYDLGDTKVFSAAVLPAIVIGLKSPAGSSSTAMTAIYIASSDQKPSREFGSVIEMLSSESSSHGRVGGTVFAIQSGTVQSGCWANPWVVATKQEGTRMNRMSENTDRRFGDVANVRVGIKTTCDEVFLRRDWSEVPEDIRPESELLRPALTHRETERWKASMYSYSVLYPYDMEQERRSPLDLEEYPRTRRYLERYRDQLSSRRYVTDGGRQWWELWVPQRPGMWRHPKIVFPDISERPRFSLDLSGAIVNGDCYWLPLVTDKQFHLGLLMLAIANSRLGTLYYDSVCGNRLYSGRRRYITQYVEKFPLPDPTSRLASEIVDRVRLLIAPENGTDVSSMEDEIETRVWRSFGLEEPAR